MVRDSRPPSALFLQIGPGDCALNNNLCLCPNCGNVESSQRGSFQWTDLDMKVRCGFCLKLNPCRSWRCKCDLQWHSCAEHRTGFCVLGTKDRSPGQPGEKPLKQEAGVTRPAPVFSLRARSAKKLKVPEIRGSKRTGIPLENYMPKAMKGPTALGPVLKGTCTLHLHSLAPLVWGECSR